MLFKVYNQVYSSSPFHFALDSNFALIKINQKCIAVKCALQIIPLVRLSNGFLGGNGSVMGLVLEKRKKNKFENIIKFSNKLQIFQKVKIQRSYKYPDIFVYIRPIVYIRHIRQLQLSTN